VSTFYEWVGRAVIGFVIRRYGAQLRTAGALTLAASVLGLGLYLATREDAGTPD
jgi:hydrogenase/urease accessory protein HupE